LTQNKLSTDEGRERATDDRSSHAQRHWIDVLLHRWPTALGIAVAALAVFDLQGGTELAALTMLMPVVYLGSAALDRRWSAWVVLLAGVAVLVVIPSSSEVVPSMIFLVAALVFLVVGVARGQLRKPGDLALQTVGVLAFGSTVLVALYVDPDLGGYLVAFAHYILTTIPVGETKPSVCSPHYPPSVLTRQVWIRPCIREPEFETLGVPDRGYAATA
jgi:uncharacterized membrane protein